MGGETKEVLLFVLDQRLELRGLIEKLVAVV